MLCYKACEKISDNYLEETLRLIKSYGVKCGAAVNPDVPVDAPLRSIFFMASPISEKSAESIDGAILICIFAPYKYKFNMFQLRRRKQDEESERRRNERTWSYGHKKNGTKRRGYDSLRRNGR